MNSSFKVFCVAFGKWRSQFLVNGNVIDHMLHRDEADAQRWCDDLVELRQKARDAARRIVDGE